MRIESRSTSTLLIIDIQERLLSAILDSASMIENTAWLQQIAQRVGVPVLLTEQYSKGLGPTAALLREGVPDTARFWRRWNFPAPPTANCSKRPGGERQQFVICGCETHVCVMQTVLDLLERGNQVFVVEEDRQLAPRLGQGAGADAHAPGRCANRFARDGGVRVDGARRHRAVQIDQPRIHPLIPSAAHRRAGIC
ncbi:hypothetical protein SSTU70S_06442 [Stutzerimonas stutzeri]